MSSSLSTQVKIESEPPYFVKIGSGCLWDLITYPKVLNASKVVIVADPIIKGIDEISTNIGRGAHLVHKHIGENDKNVETVKFLWEHFAQLALDRKSLVIAIGGGALTDTVGFAASTFMRGINVINCPTTILAQADAAVGGKTGINLAGVKNLIGTFNSPVAVFVDVKTLYTLPPREARAGCAEIIKHAFITSAQDINNVREALEVFPFRHNLLLTPDFDSQLVSLLARTIAIKANIVSRDPLEVSGDRKLLNFGHTIGHAFESCSYESDYSKNTPLLHGEAVSIGMVGEAFLSVASDKCDPSVLSTLESILFSLGLPIRTSLATAVAPEILFAKIRADKKNDFGSVRWTLLSGLGSAASDQVIQEELLPDVFQYLSSPYTGA